MNYKENEYTQIMWPDHCVKETYGEQFHWVKYTRYGYYCKKGENFLIDNVLPFQKFKTRQI